MRQDPARLSFEIQARDGDARAGLLRLAHGEVPTPAFIPLATKGSVRGLSSAEVAELGYRMVLGNTFHLHLSPGEERIAARGGLHRFMGWERAIITDSGGFQVFSLAHGGVADEIKGRRGAAPGGAKVDDLGARASRSSLCSTAPTASSARRSRWGSRRRSAPTSRSSSTSARPFHADRDYTARSTERTHRWLDRCLAWHERRGPERPGGVRDRPGRRARGPAARVGRARLGRRRRRDRDRRHAGPRQGGDVRRTRASRCRCFRRMAPRHLLGIGEIDDLLTGIGLGIDSSTARSRPASPATGRRSPRSRRRRFRIDLTKSAYAADDGPLVEGCLCEACALHTRAYLHYLARSRGADRNPPAHTAQPELHAAAHRGRQAVDRVGRLGDYILAILSGSAPWTALGEPRRHGGA